MKTTTKLFYGVLLLLTIAISKANAQMVYLPDTNFRNALIQKGFGSAIVGDSLDGGNSMVINATVLNVSNYWISDLTGVTSFINLDTLDCHGNQLSFLPQLPVNIYYLNFSGNYFTTFPQLPAALKNLDCGYNYLTTLPQLPTTLKVLDCQSNQLTYLPQIPLSMIDLNCSDNYITSIPNLPFSLIKFACYRNSLATLPLLPVGLTMLNCGYNQLTILPTLSPNLTELWCSHNQLTALPQLPTSLVRIVCEYNQLTSLPALTSAFYEFIICGKNTITSLPTLPDSVLNLYCDNNQITIIPYLPKYLEILDCSNNQLTSIPQLPDSLSQLNCTSNTNLSCLPELHNLLYLGFDSTAISCLPNYITAMYSNPLINGFPICDQFNTNGCDYYWNIAGQTYSNNNANCVYDTADTRIKNIPIQLFRNGSLLQQTTTSLLGYYDFDTDSLGIYEVKVDTTGLLFDVICPSTNLYTDTLTTTDSLKTGRDFSLQCKSGLHVGIKSIYSRFITGQLSIININAEDLALFYGMNCAAGESGIVTTTLNGPVTYLSPAAGALTPTTIIGNTLTYSVADFGALTIGAFDVMVETDTTAQAGASVCVTVTTNTTNVSGNIKMDSLQQCFVVVSSFDPNDKQVSPVSGIDINGDGWLIYTINFQNTGTAEAFNIRLLDTLDNNLDWSTFKHTAYSNEPQIQLFNTGILWFNFPNINLPDSNTNEPLSHGYVQYKIKLKQGLSLGTQIRNTAYIYFDFNPPVITNTTQNVLVTPTAIAELYNEIQFHIAPNPVQSVLTVTLSNRLPANTYIFINDMQGRIIKQEKISESTTIQLDVSTLTKGVYFIRLNGKVQRFVKM